mgnify:FL=1
MGGNPRKNPPKFSVSRYERYRTELLAWIDLADYDEDKIASVIALDLPTEGKEGDVRGKVFEDIGDTIRGDNGTTALVAWLDKHYRVDQMTRVVEKIKNFMSIKRNKDEDVSTYLSNFDVAYNSMNSGGETRMPQAFLMYLLMENAGLTDNEWQLVISGVDTMAQGTLYDQARTQITKIAGGHKHKKGDEFGFRNDTLHVDGASSVLFSGPPGQQRRFQQRPFAGQGGGGGGASNWRPNFPSYKPNHPYHPQGSGGGGNNRGGPPQVGNIKIDVPLNPIGKDGKRNVCDVCGAFTHYRARCPHNPVNYVDTTGNDFNDFEVNFVPHEEHEDSHQEAIVEAMKKMNNNDEKVKGFYATLESLVVLDVFETDVQVLNGFDMKDEVGKVILDTGCISSVTGTDWFQATYNRMSKLAKSMVKREDSTKVFKFGGGTKRQSTGTYTLPCNIGGKDISLTLDVVDQPDLPCLLSQDAMRKAKAIINFEEEKVTLFGREVKMTSSMGGHPVIQLMPYVGKEDDEEYEVLWQTLDARDWDEKFTNIMKMHEGLGHPGQKTFTKMLKSQPGFNKDVEKIINKIYEQCLSCIAFKKSIPKPKVAAPLGTDFNDTIVVDLKIWPAKGTIVLYIIDAFTKFTLGVEVEDKKADTIIEPILDEWILKRFGPPRQIMFDNGKEFSNHKMREMCETFNIQMITTAGYSPFQNGLCEKGHHLVDMMVDKMMHGNPEMSFERALSASIYAKNCLTNVNGFSPIQLVTGKQPRLPGPAQDNAPPANKTFTDHKMTHERITDIFSARKAYTEVENSNKLKKAMEIRAPKLDFYERGERAFYRKGADNHRWHGPGNVVAQDNKVIFIRHGSWIISTSPSRVLKVVQPEEEELVILNKKPEGPHQLPGLGENPARRPPPLLDDSDTEWETSSDEGQDSEQEQEGPDSDDDHDWLNQSFNDHRPDMGANIGRRQEPMADPDLGGIVRNLDGEGALDLTRDDSQHMEVDEESGAAAFQQEDGAAVTQQEEESGAAAFQQEDGAAVTQQEEEVGEKEKGRRNVEEEHPEVKVKETKRLPAKGNWIIYKEPGEQYYFRAQILLRVTKGTVKKNRFFNIQNENGTKGCINIDKKDWAIVDDPEGMVSPELISPESGKEGKKRKRKVIKNRPSPNPALRKIFKPSESVHNLITYRVDQIEMAQETEQHRAYVAMIPKNQWHQAAVIEAKEKEIANFKKHKAYEWVEDRGQSRITSGWVITQKQFGEVTGAKARLVCHGNQEREEHPSDAPTATKMGLRLLFTICAQMGWQVMTADVTSAFLQAKLDREVHVMPPKDLQRPGQLWKLKRAMYGLDDASLLWYKTVEEEMLRLGCQKLQSDPAIFYYHHPDNKTLEGLVGWHVDDLNGGGSSYFYNHVMKPLMEKFSFGSMATDNFRCLGWNIRHEDGAIFISQKDYVDAKIELLDLDKGDCTSKDLVREDFIAIVRGLIGKLRWLTDQTRIDLAFENLLLSMSAHKPTWGDVALINKLVNRVKNLEVEIKYSKLQGDQWYVTVFADASKGNLSADKSESAIAYIVFLSDGYRENQKRKCCLLTWSARKAKRVVTSTYDAEALALNTGVQAGIVMKTHLKEIMNWKDEMIKIEAFTDCNDVYKSVVLNNKPEKPNQKGDQLSSLDVAAVRKFHQQGLIDDVHWVPSELMLCDTLTKLGKAPDELVNAITRGEF